MSFHACHMNHCLRNEKGGSITSEFCSLGLKALFIVSSQLVRGSISPKFHPIGRLFA